MEFNNCSILRCALVLKLTLWLALSAPHASAQDSQGSPDETARWLQARTVVQRAEELFALGNYEGALSDYNQAYLLLRGHPRRYVVLHNLALCQERLFHYDSALEYYRRYLAEGGPDAEHRQSVEAVLETLGGLLAELIIESSVPAEIWVDNRRAESGQLHLPPGRHVVDVRAALHETQRREFQLQPRSSLRWRVVLAPLSDYRGPPPGYAWVGVALTAGTVLAGATLGALTLQARSDGLAEADASLRLRTPETEKAQRHVSDLALATDITFSAAALLAVATTVLILVSDWKPDAKPRAQPSITPGFAPGAVGIVVRGQPF